ncbi:MAG: (2Fe-2S)-binding protein [Planctomycetota bacterium]
MHDELICHCMQVRRQRILEAIRAGARDVPAVRAATRACSGCQSCWCGIEALLAEHGDEHGG